jgi:4-hydroxymandelate oxidase
MATTVNDAPESVSSIASSIEPLDGLLSLDALEALAQARLSPVAFAYVAGGAWDEWTLKENVAAFRRRRLWPRVLVDVSKIDTRVEILGRESMLPIGLAPAAEQGLCHPDAELASARAAAAAGVPFVLSTFSTASLEEVAEAAPGADLWFQLYVHRDAGITREVIARAGAAGFRVLVVTVDLPVIGHRQREIAQGSTPAPRLGTLEAYVRPGATLQDVLAEHVDPSVDWATFDRLAADSPLPVVVKGILRADDADRALEAGVRGLVVSNHGGRQLDRAPASIDALEPIVQEVGDRAEVYLDGGVRRGLDVITAVALGARAVFVGRPYLYALALDGERGVTRVLELLASELRIAMALAGSPRIEAIDRGLLDPI